VWGHSREDDEPAAASRTLDARGRNQEQKCDRVPKHKKASTPVITTESWYFFLNLSALKAMAR
jgi:hypothetical protein